MLLTDLTFLINKKKSVKEPSQEVTMLEFILDSSHMTMRLTQEKEDNLKMLCEAMRLREHTSIQKLTELIGKPMVFFQVWSLALSITRGLWRH